MITIFFYQNLTENVFWACQLRWPRRPGAAPLLPLLRRSSGWWPRPHSPRFAGGTELPHLRERAVPLHPLNDGDVALCLRHLRQAVVASRALATTERLATAVVWQCVCVAVWSVAVWRITLRTSESAAWRASGIRLCGRGPGAAPSRCPAAGRCPVASSRGAPPAQKKNTRHRCTRCQAATASLVPARPAAGLAAARYS